MKCYTFKKDDSLGKFALSEGIFLTNNGQPRLMLGGHGNYAHHEEVYLHRLHPPNLEKWKDGYRVLDSRYEKIRITDDDTGLTKTILALAKTLWTNDLRVLLHINTNNISSSNRQLGGDWDLVHGGVFKLAGGYVKRSLNGLESTWYEILLVVAANTALYVKPEGSDPYLIYCDQLAEVRVAPYRHFFKWHPWDPFIG